MLAPPHKQSILARVLGLPAAGQPSQPPPPSPMPPVTREQLEALRKCLKDKSLQFSYKGARNKRGAAFVQVGIILLSVATPILIGWKDPANKQLLLNLALASSALTAGINMLHNFFDYKDLWAQYKVARNELEFILAELDFLEASGLANVTQQQASLLFKRYQQVCNDTNNFYREVRLAKDDNGAPKK